ncbi:NTF2 fold immunity protein [Pseudoduganella violaceinigra]|uniref:NTF2 fold immunity protein n=1 Tax=Pseudoduganella violaceinigra TaxID=246602 RepID=UPI000A061E93|nr:NTF2 fold immunity protein [Pseudoduganella violaceinigra]
MKNLTTLSFLFLFAANALAQSSEPHNFKPEAGYVPDAMTAIRIAISVWTPIYGEKKIASEAPYRAVLVDGFWIVEGTAPKGYKGGVAVAEISKNDATVRRITHGK